jgi:hypothetical protein
MSTTERSWKSWELRLNNVQLGLFINIINSSACGLLTIKIWTEFPYESSASDQESGKRVFLSLEVRDETRCYISSVTAAVNVQNTWVDVSSYELFLEC